MPRITVHLEVLNHFFFNYFVEVLHNEIVYLELDLSQGEAEGPELGRCVYGGGMK